MRKKEKRSDYYEPKVIEYVNDITGKRKWRVVKINRGAPGLPMPPFSRDFETKAEAIQCYADNFGWSKVDEFQPTEDDVEEAPF